MSSRCSCCTETVFVISKQFSPAEAVRRQSVSVLAGAKDWMVRESAGVISAPGRRSNKDLQPNVIDA